MVRQRIWRIYPLHGIYYQKSLERVVGPFAAVKSAPSMYRFSQRLAWVAGVVLPVGETIRRWGTWWDVPAAYLDDVIIGAFFLFGAWMSRQSSPVGTRCLAAAYGCACGIGFLSLIFGVSTMNQTDPSGVSALTAVIVKVALVSLGLVGLVGALRGPEAKEPTTLKGPVRTPAGR
jgi:hypothetical protein